MITLDELSKMSKSELCNIYAVANYWIWPSLLGEEPEGWSEMPNYKKPYMDDCVITKEDIIRPYMLEIRKKVSYLELQEATSRLHTKL